MSLETVIDSIKRLKIVKIKASQVLLSCLCRSFRKHRGHKAMQELVKFHTDQLDIRKIISNSIGLKDFLRCFLSEPQKALLSMQRTRIATAMKDSDKSGALETY